MEVRLLRRVSNSLTIKDLISAMFQLGIDRYEEKHGKVEVRKCRSEKKEMTIRSSAAEYLTYVAAVGDRPEAIEIRYEDENVWLTQKMSCSNCNV